MLHVTKILVLAGVKFNFTGTRIFVQFWNQVVGVHGGDKIDFFCLASVKEIRTTRDMCKEIVSQARKLHKTMKGMQSKQQHQQKQQ